jgi:hypothetical protein
MNNHYDITKLQVLRKWLLQQTRNLGIVAGCASTLFAIPSFRPYITCLPGILAVACLWIFVAFYGLAYLVAGWHIRRMTGD